MKITTLDFIRYVFRFRRRLFVVFSCLCLALLVMVFTTPKEYTAKAEFLVTSNEGNSLSAASSLAQFAGIDLPSSDAGSSVNPKVYEEFLKSKDLLIDILDDSVTLQNGETVLLKNYVDDDLNDNIFSRLVKSLSSGLMNIVRGESRPSNSVSNEVYDFRWLSRDEENIVNKLSKRISFDYELERSLITMEVKLQDPLASTMILSKLSSALELYVENYINKGQEEQLEFVSIILEQKEKHYDSVSLELASFRDENINITSYVISEKLRELERLESMASQLLIQTQKTYEQELIEKEKKQIRIRQIDKLSVPVKPSSLRKLYAIPMVFVASFFLTIIFAVSILTLESIKNYLIINDVFKR